MIKEAIILAGGLGTRLQSVVSDKPKCLATVAGKPFLNFLISFLQVSGIEKFIFSVGHKHEMIEEYLKNNFPETDYKISLEDEPLGTGGAIKLASEKTSEKNILICNGDTLFKISVDELSKFHDQVNAHCTLCLKPMINFDRYGVVELNKNGSVKLFKEKHFYKNGLINGGVYALNVASFLKENLPQKFSFEKDYLEKQVGKKKLYGIVQNKYFIDIGIPEDYARAQDELKASPQPLSAGEGAKLKSYPKLIDLKNIDKTWTLFLDRDGVINIEKRDDYIHNWDQFKFYDGVKEALSIFSKKFGKIFVITNQRGVGKGIHKLEDLEIIHSNMLQEFSEAEGKIDKIYYSIDIEDDHPNRKPNTGMGLQAQKDFPEVNFSKSIMIGNTLSDMKFGRNLNVAANIFLPTRKEIDVHHPDIDFVFDDLLSFANAL